MKYIIVPAEIINQVPKSELDALHLDPRYSTDGSEVIMKLVHYEQLFPAPITLELLEEASEPVYPYPVFENGSLDLELILNTTKWKEDENSRTMG